MFRNVPKGINSRPTSRNKDYIYIVFDTIISLDADGLMRCGQMSGYKQTNDLRHWIGFTTAQIFKKGWRGMRYPLDPSASQEPIFGKPCYVGRWQTDVRVDITRDQTVVTPLERIGIVINEAGHFAAVRMDPGFTSTPHFQNDGFWAQC